MKVKLKPNSCYFGKLKDKIIEVEKCKCLPGCPWWRIRPGKRIIRRYEFTIVRKKK